MPDPAPRRDALAVPGRLRRRLEVRQVLPGITELGLSTAATRRLGFPSSAWRVDDALVDTSFAHVREEVMEQLAGRDLRWIALTHHHEDHAGNAGPLSRRHRCAVYLRHAAERDTEGIVHLAPYRRLYWGWTGPWDAEEAPPVLETRRRRLRVVPTPGHSRTHSALLDEDSGAVFTGDLYLGPGAVAVMSHEDPWALARSLRRVADLEPSRLLGGHGQDLPRPAAALRDKAGQVLAFAEQAVEMSAQGLDPPGIARRLWPRRTRQDRLFDLLTEGQFSYTAFVRAALAHAPA